MDTSGHPCSIRVHPKLDKSHPWPVPCSTSGQTSSGQGNSWGAAIVNAQTGVGLIDSESRFPASATPDADYPHVRKLQL